MCEFQTAPCDGISRPTGKTSLHARIEHAQNFPPASTLGNDPRTVAGNITRTVTSQLTHQMEQSHR